MQIKTEQNNGVAIVNISGHRLDLANANAFRQAMEPILIENQNVLFDFEGLRFIDSSGLGAILHSLRELRSREGNLKLCNMRPVVRSLFELVRMHKIIENFDSREEALKSY